MNALIAEARRLLPSLSRSICVVYFLRLRSGTLYIGSSTDLEQRLADHASRQACRTTALDPPLALLRVEVCSTFCEARVREAQLKRWSRLKKEALVRGDFDQLRKLSHSTRRQSTACPFDGLRVPSDVEWTHGLRPAYPNT